MPDERLSNAVCFLATSPEPIQERLIEAGTLLIPLLPKEFRRLENGEGRFQSLIRELTSAPVEVGTLRATCKALSDADAAALAKKIFQLHKDMAAQRGEP